MACGSITLKGIGLGCKDHMGGIKEVYLIKEDEITIAIGLIFSFIMAIILIIISIFIIIF